VGGPDKLVRTGRERGVDGGCGERIRTFPCARGECAGVDEKVLAIVEQAHSCTRKREHRLIAIIHTRSRDGE
jgi:hypothetical protein